MQVKPRPIPSPAKVFERIIAHRLSSIVTKTPGMIPPEAERWPRRLHRRKASASSPTWYMAPWRARIGWPPVDEAILYTLQLAAAMGDTFQNEARAGLRRIGARVRWFERRDRRHRRLPIRNGTGTSDPSEIMDLVVDPGVIPTDADYDRVMSATRGAFAEPRDEAAEGLFLAVEMHICDLGVSAMA